ncbi:unnamed protein product, partial [Staurois parvus]
MHLLDAYFKYACNMYNQRSPLRMDEVSRVRNLLPLDGVQPSECLLDIQGSVPAREGNSLLWVLWDTAANFRGCALN